MSANQSRGRILLVPVGKGCTANSSFWREVDKTFYVQLRVRCV